MADGMIPNELITQQKRITDLKTLLSRLEKGTQMMEKAIDERNDGQFKVLSKTYIEVMHSAVSLLENTQYYQEFLASGRSVLIQRNGNVKNMMNDYTTRPFDASELSAILKLSEVFGPDAIDLIEFEEAE